MAVSRLVGKINEIIADHNQANQEFDTTKEAARTKIKAHHLAEGQENYRELECGERETSEAFETARVNEERLRAEIGELRGKLRGHGEAAEAINRMLASYLGHSELRLAPAERGYEIRRNGEPATGPPSEGEKTAIALCFFLASLREDGRQLEDLIVVVDDPISSLDTRALNYAYNLLRSHLERAAQLIILAHNLHFMNEVKKWLKGKTVKGVKNKAKAKVTAELLYLDTTQPKGKRSRQTSIIEMPRHIREHESEYHHLFNLLLRFHPNKSDRDSYFYIMPNAARKVLEIFLAFKAPGEALKDAIDGFAKNRDEHGLDINRLHAVERLPQVESHADNLDDLITSSSMTIEETDDAIEGLLHMIKALDAAHHRRMLRLCSAG